MVNTARCVRVVIESQLYHTPKLICWFVSFHLCMWVCVLVLVCLWVCLSVCVFVCVFVCECFCGCLWVCVRVDVRDLHNPGHVLMSAKRKSFDLCTIVSKVVIYWTFIWLYEMCVRTQPLIISPVIFRKRHAKREMQEMVSLILSSNRRWREDCKIVRSIIINVAMDLSNGYFDHERTLYTVWLGCFSGSDKSLPSCDFVLLSFLRVNLCIQFEICFLTLFFIRYKKFRLRLDLLKFSVLWASSFQKIFLGCSSNVEW